MKNSFTILTLLLSSILVSAQSVFDVSLTDVNTDQAVSLKDYKSSKGMAIVFMSAKCPYAKHYELRLLKMAKEYKNQGIPFLMVNANTTESNEIMKAQAKKINTVYLSDKFKALKNRLSAKKSPEVFLLKGNGDVYYSGAIDDNPQVAGDVHANYLEDAIDRLLKGRAITTSNTHPVGCMIK